MSLKCVACSDNEKLKRVFLSGRFDQRYESHFLCAACLQKNNKKAEVCYFLDLPAPTNEEEGKKMSEGWKLTSRQWSTSKKK